MEEALLKDDFSVVQKVVWTTLPDRIKDLQLFKSHMPYQSTLTMQVRALRWTDLATLLQRPRDGKLLLPIVKCLRHSLLQCLVLKPKLQYGTAAPRSPKYCPARTRYTTTAPLCTSPCTQAAIRDRCPAIRFHGRLPGVLWYTQETSKYKLSTYYQRDAVRGCL